MMSHLMSTTSHINIERYNVGMVTLLCSGGKRGEHGGNWYLASLVSRALQVHTGDTISNMHTN